MLHFNGFILAAGIFLSIAAPAEKTAAHLKNERRRTKEDGKIEPKSCRDAIFGKLSEDGLPQFWAQRLLRPRDDNTFLLQSEISEPVSFGVIDNGELPKSDPALKGIFPDDTHPAPDEDTHARNVVGLITSRSESAICPPVGTRLSNFTNIRRLGATRNEHVIESLKQLLASDSKVRVVNISIPERPLWGQRTELLQVLRELYNQDRVNVIWSAGNYYGSEGALFPLMPPNILPVSNISRFLYRLARDSSYVSLLRCRHRQRNRLRVYRKNYSEEQAEPLHWLRDRFFY